MFNCVEGNHSSLILRLSGINIDTVLTDTIKTNLRVSHRTHRLVWNHEINTKSNHLCCLLASCLNCGEYNSLKKNSLQFRFFFFKMSMHFVSKLSILSSWGVLYYLVLHLQKAHTHRLLWGQFSRVFARSRRIRGPDMSTARRSQTSCKQGNKRAAAVNGAGGAEDRSVFYTQGKSFITVMLDRNCAADS